MLLDQRADSDTSSLSDISLSALDGVDLSKESTFMKVAIFNKVNKLISSNKQKPFKALFIHFEEAIQGICRNKEQVSQNLYVYVYKVYYELGWCVLFRKQV